jgi:hypothetical protein
MRKPNDLDRMLENAVATALGLDLPHPEEPRRLIGARARAAAARRRHAALNRRDRFAA